MGKLKVGIAGYGIVGPRRHQFINQHPDMEVVAISDILHSEALSVKDGITWYQHYKDLVNSDLDVLFVCLPNQIAPEVTILGLEKGLHVFCEKPPGRTVGDIRKVIEVERRHPQLKLKYGFNHRYHDSVREALRIVQEGQMGKVLNIRGVYGKSAVVQWDSPDEKNWRTKRAFAGGGILLDQGIHMVDLMRAFADGEFEDVKSFVKNTFWNYDVEDNAYALMQTDKGVVAMLHSTATQWKHRFTLEIYMTKGSLSLSGILSGTKSYGQESLTITFREEGDQGNPREQTTTYIRDNSWRDEVFEFADCILKDQPVKVGSSYDSLKTMELVYRIYCSDPQWQAKYNITSE